MPVPGWIRLCLDGDPSQNFLLPSATISTYSNLSAHIHAIFNVSAAEFPTFSIAGTGGCGALSPRLWDLGVFFTGSPATAVVAHVRFFPGRAATASPRTVEAARALLALSRQQEGKEEEEEEEKGEDEGEEEEKEEKEQQQQEEGRGKRSRSSSSSGSSSSPVVPTKRVRLLSPSPAAAAPPSSPAPQARGSSGSSLSELGAEVELELEREDRELAWRQQQQQQEEEEKDEEEEDEGEKERKDEGFVTLYFSFVNRMTRSHGVSVGALRLAGMSAARLLADFEDEVKSHACEAFLLDAAGRRRGRMSERQAFALGESLAVRILVEGGGGVDALRERRAVGEYAVVEEEDGGGAGRIVRATVEIWREEDIAMEVLRRVSPTRDEEEEG
ncbi:hypothetical protein SLS58_010052 [Diplodia intermedia]|uniref:Uncharacterized protein n=1 Tax=Diplodia intermedia TaxID=856260 RepID=A0ABR3T8K2_9PEZI